MIEVKCDHCGKVEKEPKESVNIYHVWKNDIVEIDNTHKNRHQLCKSCYGKWCNIYDAFDHDVEEYRKSKEIEKTKFSNEFCKFT